MTRFLSLRWRLAGTFFIVVLALVTLIGLYLLKWTESYYIRSVSDDLRRESLAVAVLVRSEPPDMPGLITRMGHGLDHRITIIRSDGFVLADSEHDYRGMENHSNRPEIRQALATGHGAATRYSRTVKMNMLYVATRLGAKGGNDGVIRVAESLSGLNEVISTIQRAFLIAGLIVVVIAAVMSLRIASSIITPIESVSRAARRLARGELSARAPKHSKLGGELGELAATFNDMAQQLQSTIGKITEQEARMQAIFDRTDDGLVLVGHDGRVRMINPAASRMLGVSAASAIEKTVIEGALSHELAGLVERTVRTGEPSALDIALPAGDDNAAYAYVAPILCVDGRCSTLIVVHDVTASRQLDAIRRDFVANVSHELRTPLASIKAMAETILLRHKNDPSAAPQFAGGIVREADRMTLLAEDLLDLAKIESGERANSTETANVRTLVEEVFERLVLTAEKKSIELNLDVAEDVLARADCDSVCQILVNLIDNAVKYTIEGGKVTVTAARNGDQVTIRVIDTGIGIPPEELPRVFERFYRVDKARSRESGGTGLGLSIVKHLVELLGGSIAISSEVGKGSTLAVTLPAG